MSQTFQLTAADQGLRKISESLKEHYIQTWGHCLTRLEAILALGPKTKFEELHLNYNFPLRSNLSIGT